MPILADKIVALNATDLVSAETLELVFAQLANADKAKNRPASQEDFHGLLQIHVDQLGDVLYGEKMTNLPPNPAHYAACQVAAIMLAYSDYLLANFDKGPQSPESA